MPKVITRFAPSPTGHLHIGGARTALFCWLLARHYGGEFRLRIEDTDLERSKQEYTDSILASMRWLGLDWDGELSYQTKRTDLYNAAVDRLLAEGKAYWCSCTPEEVEAMRESARAQGKKPRYDGRCRYKKQSYVEGSVVRLNLDAVMPGGGSIVFDDMVKGIISTDVSELDDMVLRRSDGMPTYNMAVVVDDHDMGITHVLRGDDHVPNTPKQILLYKALGWDLPVFGHVPMILGPDKQKLSKRHGARAVVEYKKDGLLPETLVNCLVRLGWSHGDREIFTLDELVCFFDGKNLNSSAACFDFEKLNWYNAHYLHEKSEEELAELVAPFVKERGVDASAEMLVPIVKLFRERASNLIELADNSMRLLVSAETLEYDPKSFSKALTEEGKAQLRAIADVFATESDFSSAHLDEVINNYLESNALKYKQIGPPLRVALIGTQNGPHIPDIMEVLGREASFARINHALIQ